MREKAIYKNKNGKIIRITDNFGYNRYVLLDSSGNYKKDLPQIFAVKEISELFPNN